MERPKQTTTTNQQLKKTTKMIKQKHNETLVENTKTTLQHQTKEDE